MRDAQGNILATYEKTYDLLDIIKLEERYIYGSQRLGILQEEIDITSMPEDVTLYERTLGKKNYELTNHLGSVMITVTDRKIPHDDYTNLALNVGTGNWDPSGSPDGSVDYFTADVTNAYDYYSAAGQLMPGRIYDGSYRHGAQGSEVDPEINGTRNTITTFYREGDLRLLQWDSPDNVKPNTSESPYAMMARNNVWFNDQLGDTVAMTDRFKNNAAWMASYMIWSNTSAGKRFLKDYGIGGKFEKVSVIFDVGEMSQSGAMADTRTFIVDKNANTETKIESGTVYAGASKIAKGDDPTRYLKMVLNFDQTIKDLKPPGANSFEYGPSLFWNFYLSESIIHETQHLEINRQTLISNQSILDGVTHHRDWMKQKNTDWYKQRYNYYVECKHFWYQNYLRLKNLGKVQSEEDYIKRMVNLFVN